MISAMASGRCIRLQKQGAAFDDNLSGHNASVKSLWRGMVVRVSMNKLLFAGGI